MQDVLKTTRFSIFASMEFNLNVFAQPGAWVSLLTLTFLEIVLGVDNIIFISLVTSRLPEGERKKAQKLGMLMALALRITLLCFIGWILGLTEPLFSVFGKEITGRALILFFGGVFLIYKSTTEIHHKVTHDEEAEMKTGKGKAFFAVLIQIALLDIVFSFDSILTAVGLAKEVIVMIVAVVISMFVMMQFTEPVGKLVTKYPTLQILALSFLIMIGMTLIMEGLEFHVDKRIVYVSVLFSLIVEVINIRYRKKTNHPH